MEFAEPGRGEGAVFRVAVVAGAVKVGRHGSGIAGAVLAIIGLAHLDAGDIDKGIEFVGRYKRTGR